MKRRIVVATLVIIFFALDCNNNGRMLQLEEEFSSYKKQQEYLIKILQHRASRLEVDAERKEQGLPPKKWGPLERGVKY